MGLQMENTSRLKKMLEALEKYRARQLEVLAEEYNSRMAAIRDNYALRSDQLRTSYLSQTERYNPLFLPHVGVSCGMGWVQVLQLQGPADGDGAGVLRGDAGFLPEPNGPRPGLRIPTDGAPMGVLPETGTLPLAFPSHDLDWTGGALR